MRGASGSKIWYGQSGQAYVMAGNTWFPCPLWPPRPELATMDVPSAVASFRYYWDICNYQDKYLKSLTIPNAVTQYVYLCPNVSDGPYVSGQAPYNFMASMAAKFGQAATYKPFSDWLMWKVMPESGPDTITKFVNYTYNPQTPPVRPDPNVVAQYATNLSNLVTAWNSVPWPHPFMQEFLTKPLVTLPPFANGYAITEPNLATTSYFPKSASIVMGDIAKFIVANEDLFNQHFNARVEKWLHDLQDDIDKAQNRMEAFNKFMTILGLVLDVVSGGLGSVVTSAISAPYTISQTKKLTSMQVSAMKQLADNLGITQQKMDDFRAWILANVGKPTMDIPPTPQGGGTSTFSVFIENQYWKSFANQTDAIKSAFASTKAGQRIILKNEASGQIDSMYIREDAGLRKVPPSVAGTLQALPASSAQNIAGGGSSGSSGLLLLAAVPLLLKMK